MTFLQLQQVQIAIMIRGRDYKGEAIQDPSCPLTLGESLHMTQSHILNGLAETSHYIGLKVASG